MKSFPYAHRFLPLLTGFALLLGALACNGCQTVNGAGKDIEHAGEHIQDASKK